MVQFYNRQEERYVTLSTPNTEDQSSDILFPETFQQQQQKQQRQEQQGTLFDKIVTKCKGDLVVVKVVVVVVCVWLVILSYKCYVHMGHWERMDHTLLLLENQRGEPNS